MNCGLERTHMISAVTHTTIDDGQVLWIVARPYATVLAELIATEAADADSDENADPARRPFWGGRRAALEAYGAYCGDHPAVAEFAEADKMRDEHGLPTVRYVTGQGWE